MHVLVTCKYETDQIKSNREKVETSFSLLPLKTDTDFKSESVSKLKSSPGNILYLL